MGFDTIRIFFRIAAGDIEKTKTIFHSRKFSYFNGEHLVTL